MNNDTDGLPGRSRSRARIGDTWLEASIECSTEHDLFDVSLSLRAADELSANRITVVVENALGMAESAPATVAIAAPARLEILPDLSSIRAWGTPNGRYQIEFTQDLGSAGVWSAFGEVEIPSFGTPARVKNLSAYDYGPIPLRFYRAVIRP